ncbi:MAG: Asp-tRNA(Asn)/Glu-tRNA(Gln) amidotransferase subunit GatA [Bacteroidetes bacterium]|nr:Asp-tRNA(Asn)/Glu-tRNA(Gln) amidotransferase subunit GatA [Bacteroidota bacterium]
MFQYRNHSEKLNQIKSGSLSLKENIAGFLSGIREKENLNAFNFIFDDALERSEIVENKIKNNEHGKLAGMVIGIKDVLSIQDKPLTCSSKILKNFEAIFTATAVQRLLDEDAIIIGKTNCDEFAMGSSNENSAFGNVKNPIDITRVPGGSSGGSAAAVAAGLCDAAIGTDTGGSIRQPASFCGVYGLKPTYGRISRYGLTAFASSFDSIGPFANNIDDIALITEVMSGHDPMDSTCSKTTTPDFSNTLNVDRKFRIGVPSEYFGEGLNSEVRKAVESVIHKMSDNGFEIVDIHLPHNEYSIAAYYILTTAEASSNLARYDGVRYSHRTAEKQDLIGMYTKSRSEGFGDEVKRRIMLGTYVLSAGYYDAYYGKAQKVRRLVKSDFDAAFEKVDVILTPTSPFTAFKLGEKSADPLQMYLSDVYTTSANLAGIPGLNIPIGFDKDGLPIGMQVLANQFKELTILQLAKSIEKII